MECFNVGGKCHTTDVVTHPTWTPDLKLNIELRIYNLNTHEVEERQWEFAGRCDK